MASLGMLSNACSICYGYSTRQIENSTKILLTMADMRWNEVYWISKTGSTNNLSLRSHATNAKLTHAYQ